MPFAITKFPATLVASLSITVGSKVTIAERNLDRVISLSLSTKEMVDETSYCLSMAGVSEILSCHSLTQALLVVPASYFNAPK